MTVFEHIKNVAKDVGIDPERITCAERGDGQLLFYIQGMSETERAAIQEAAKRHTPIGIQCIFEPADVD